MASRAAAASAPWIAAPIEPAQVPSSAGTTSTSSSDVVWTRRRSSSRIGSSSRSNGDRDPAADDDPVGREDHDHVGDPDAEVAADLREPGERLGVAGPRSLDGRLDRLGAARRGDPVGPGERLEAAVVAAAARRAVRVDRLVADLAGRPVMPEMDAAVDRDDATDPGPERQPDHRLGATAGTEPELGQAEGPRVVDQGDRDAEGRLERRARRLARPVVRHVDEEAGRAGRRVVQPGHADPERRDRGPSLPIASGRSSPMRPMTASGPSLRPGRHLAAVEDPPLVAVVPRRPPI